MTIALGLITAWVLSTTALIIFLHTSVRRAPDPHRRDEGSARAGVVPSPGPAATSVWHPSHPAPTVRDVGGYWLIEYPNGRDPYIAISTEWFEAIVEARNDAVKAGQR